MNKDMIKSEMMVNDRKINVLRIDNKDYISLTDLARYADSEEPRLPIRDWMRSKEVISYLGLWEQLNNINFKGGEFDTFKNEAGSNKFKMSPQKWIRETNAIGIISKSGRYDGGTFAHPDIADKGNIRDYTDLLHLVILNNLENINAELIEIGMSQSERLIKLNKMAKRQMELLKNNKSFNNLEYIEYKVNKNEMLTLQEKVIFHINSLFYIRL